MPPRIIPTLIAAVLVATASTQPTAGPPVTGSMYNGNNAQAPRLTDPPGPAPVVQMDRDVGGDAQNRRTR
jgi:hypothetical protein